jgi:hypothetical protein
LKFTIDDLTCVQAALVVVDGIALSPASFNLTLYFVIIPSVGSDQAS